MGVIRAFYTEWKKHPKLVLILLISGLPAFLTLVKTAAFLARKPHMILKGQYNWTSFIQAGFAEWRHMLLPLMLAVWAVHICRVEHINRGWKMVLTQPLPRWHVLLSKFMMLIVWLWVFLASHFLFHAACGAVLFPAQSLALGSFFKVLLFASVFLLPILAVQLAMSLYLQHAIVPLGVCLVGNLVALMGSGWFLKIWPWRFTQFIGFTDLTKASPHLSAALLVTAALFIATAIGFQRKEV